MKKINENKIARAINKFNKITDEDWQKLSDKYERLKVSHKKQERLLMDFRNFLIANQNGILTPICPDCVQGTLRQVNLALGFNQWTGVKGIK